ncbi:MAG: prolipoprotein diacylglyceryl transferase [Firmicutes bacterium]|nr:prolipoprotein diacylglyceryl transferase [Bacillota bacterium]
MGFTVFGLEIRWYGIIIAAAILVAFFIVMQLYKKKNYKEDVVYHLVLLIVPIAIIGARIFYVVFSPVPVSLFSIRDGGLAIYGGVLAAILVVFIYARIRKIGFFTLSDAIVIGLILAQSIGRWGNFLNQEAFGVEVGFHFFPITVRIGDAYHLATFFYESFLNLIGFVLLLQIFRKQKKFGTTTAWYFIFYGIVRAAIEPLRTDSLTIWGASDFVLNRVSFILSLILIVVGVIILVLNHKNKINQNNANIIQKPKEEETKDAKHE